MFVLFDHSRAWLKKNCICSNADCLHCPKNAVCRIYLIIHPFLLNLKHTIAHILYYSTCEWSNNNFCRHFSFYEATLFLFSFSFQVLLLSVVKIAIVPNIKRPFYELLWFWPNTNTGKIGPHFGPVRLTPIPIYSNGKTKFLIFRLLFICQLNWCASFFIFTENTNPELNSCHIIEHTTAKNIE